jgi:hypothetical protein
LLANGKVLVAAGMNHLGTATYLSSAELFDPATGTFTGTGPLVSVRTGHGAALLPSGRVVLVGGLRNPNSAEVYDPVAGRFYSRDLPRTSHTATLLTDGRVFLAGGSTSNAATETFDVLANAFSTSASLLSARQAHTATLLPNGAVLLVGGWGTQYATLASAEIFDPTTGSISGTGALTTSRTSHTATTLADGRVLIVGGWSGAPSSSGTYAGKPVATTEIFDPATGTFHPSGSLATARFSHAATLLPDGKVLIAGGSDSRDPARTVAKPNPLASAEIFDPESGGFTLAPSMTMPRLGSTATLLPDGEVLVVGGNAAGMNGHETVARAELFR